MKYMNMVNMKLLAPLAFGALLGTAYAVCYDYDSGGFCVNPGATTAITANCLATPFTFPPTVLYTYTTLATFTGDASGVPGDKAEITTNQGIYWSDKTATQCFPEVKWIDCYGQAKFTGRTAHLDWSTASPGFPYDAIDSNSYGCQQ